MVIVKKMEIMFIGLIFFILFSCNERPSLYNEYLASPKNPKVSPSGKYLLHVIEGYDGQVHFNRFEIMGKKEQNIIFSSKDYFRTRDTLFFLWDKEDRVWVYSGDLGTFYWIYEQNGQWIKHAYSKENIEAPKFLKQIRPKYHSK